MNLNLENGYTVTLPSKGKHNIYYGPNKIGKTQISRSMKKYYEEISEKVLLFNENILSDMIIQSSEDINSFEVMPMAQEYNKYYNNMQKSKEKLSMKNSLKDLCLVNTKKAFQGFEKISEYINDDNTYSYNGDALSPVYSQDDIKDMYKPKKVNMNIFEIIDNLKKDNIKIIPDNVKKIVEYDIYNIQLKINQDPDKYKNCPVCFSPICQENLDKIRESIENGSIEKELQLSILFYLDNKSDILRNKMSEILLCESYESFEKDFKLDVEKSIISYLSNQYDKKDVINYKENKTKVEEILNKTKDFKINENVELSNYIKNKLKNHTVYKNTDIEIKISDGKLKVLNSQVEYDKMSKSEQNYFKFLYFDILVHQKILEGNLHIIIDDPFDSYDDIYVQDSIAIITKLINEHIEDIDTIDIFSHSMYILDLYDSLKKIYNKFNIYWMDQIGLAKEINIFEDGYHLFEKIDINPYDYGIILKISDKMVDKYSLIAFAALLRNEINVERWLFKNNSNSELSDVKNKVEELYNKISESIGHVREEISIIELNNIINEIFYFGLNDNEIQNVSSLFDDISNDYVDIDIKAKTGSGNIVSVPKNDICYILIYKILFGLKIRRLLEKKVYDIVQEDYTEVGDLIEKIPNTPLYDYYNLYKYIINSFNHSSSRVVPPIFVYSFKSLREMYEELQAL